MPSDHRPHWRDPLVALALLTRIPAPVDHSWAGRRLGASVWAFPLVGAALGAGVGAVAWGLLALGAPAGVAAAAAIAAGLLATGAMHEDGLADCADGLGGGGADRAPRLEIMRDSRIGAFGAAALCLALVAKWSLIAALPPTALIPVLAASGALSRAPLGPMMRLMPAARPDGLAVAAGRPPPGLAALGLALGAALGLVFAGAAATPALGLALAAAALVGWRAMRLIGGRTGDVLGAAQVLAEIAALAALAA